MKLYACADYGKGDSRGLAREQQVWEQAKEYLLKLSFGH